MQTQSWSWTSNSKRVVGTLTVLAKWTQAGLFTPTQAQAKLKQQKQRRGTILPTIHCSIKGKPPAPLSRHNTNVHSGSGHEIPKGTALYRAHLETLRTHRFKIPQVREESATGGSIIVECKGEQGHRTEEPQHVVSSATSGRPGWQPKSVSKEKSPVQIKFRLKKKWNSLIFRSLRHLFCTSFWNCIELVVLPRLV